MYNIIIGSLIISLLHAVIPNHWLPIIAIGKKDQWPANEVMKVTFICALAHGASTIIIGIVLGFLGSKLDNLTHFSNLVAPVILIGLGFLFIYRHHRHKHFHLNDETRKTKSKSGIIAALIIAMFFSPCMEIEAYFLLAGTISWWLVLVIAMMYLLITIAGMLLLVRYVYAGLFKSNWHFIEHKAGIITGWTLVLTGLLSFFIF